MPSIHDQVSEQFHQWELRGRGWQVFDEPVAPEPPFEPFLGYRLAPTIDDGIRPTRLSSFVANLSQRQKAPPLLDSLPTVPHPEPEAPLLVREEDLIEFQTTLPANLAISKESF